MILGIDPGVSGALAVLDPHGPKDEPVVVAAEEMPTVKRGVGNKRAQRGRREIDLHRLAGLLRPDRDQIKYAMIEEVHSMPKQGVASTFSFGRSSMAPEAILAALEIPYIFVRPEQWKRTMQVSADKQEAIRKANQLFPEQTHLWRKPRRRGNTRDNWLYHDGKAEAVLLALYGLRTVGPDIRGKKA